MILLCLPNCWILYTKVTTSTVTSEPNWDDFDDEFKKDEKPTTTVAFSSPGHQISVASPQDAGWDDFSDDFNANLYESPEIDNGFFETSPQQNGKKPFVESSKQAYDPFAESTEKLDESLSSSPSNGNKSSSCIPINNPKSSLSQSNENASSGTDENFLGVSPGWVVQFDDANNVD